MLFVIISMPVATLVGCFPLLAPCLSKGVRVTVKKDDYFTHNRQFTIYSGNNFKAVICSKENVYLLTIYITTHRFYESGRNNNGKQTSNSKK